MAPRTWANTEYLRAYGDTPYDVLQIGPQATHSEVKRAFHHASRLHHPDRTRTADSQFIMVAINAAYEVLRDEKRRRYYDATGRIDYEVKTAHPYHLHCHMS